MADIEMPKTNKQVMDELLELLRVGNRMAMDVRVSSIALGLGGQVVASITLRSYNGEDEETQHESITEALLHTRTLAMRRIRRCESEIKRIQELKEELEFVLEPVK